MKFLCITLLSVVSISSSFAQILFEEGHFISNNGEMTKCFIKNKGWKNNPTEFEYKTSEASESLIGSIDNIQEFAISNGPKYVRFTVQVDQSSDDLANLSRSRNPEFKKETLFLKVVLEGKATLFAYESFRFDLFFYRMDLDSVRQLIHKKYRTSDNQIAYNNSYKEQLWTDLKCEDIKKSQVTRVSYFSNSLKNLFIKYNSCQSPSFKIETTKKRDILNLSLRPGINFANASMENLMFNTYNTEFKKKLSPRFGIEAEFVLPFNNNKWAFVIEPTYQSYSDKKGDVTIDYKSFELPLGIRYYIFLNDNSKLFVNAMGVFNFLFDSGISIESYQDLSISEGVGYALGAGYNLKKYSVEIRYNRSRQILEDYPYWNGEFNHTSLIVGYRLF